WADLTGSLGQVLSKIKTIALCNPTGLPGQGYLLAGGMGGVYSLPLTSANGCWKSFGLGLPSVQVTDLHYVPEKDAILAATFGRGAWLISAASNSLSSTAITDVTVTDDDTRANHIVIGSVSGDDCLEIVVNDRVEYSGPWAGIGSIQVIA